MARRGLQRRGLLPKINRNDTSREVVKEAAKILLEVRGKAQYLIPFRLMNHLPNHDTLIRPVDTVRATFIGTGIGTSGFRRHEPCCTSDPIPEIGLRRYIIGGNHRVASTRDSGQVLVPTNRISCKHMRKLMRLLREEDEALLASGFMAKHYEDQQQAFRCLEILSVTLQGLEPAPKPLTCLQQVQVIRTAARNDLTLDLCSRSTASYGGVAGLRQRIVPGHPGTDDSSIHFLLNNKMGLRHKNKLLAGARVLIFSDNSFEVPGLGPEVSLLDVLIHWEAKGYMGTFLDTHLSYIGPMSLPTLTTIMDSTRRCIEDKNHATTPFNTSAFRMHVGAPASKRKAKDVKTGDSIQSKKKKAKTSSKKTAEKASGKPAASDGGTAGVTEKAKKAKRYALRTDAVEKSNIDSRPSNTTKNATEASKSVASPKSNQDENGLEEKAKMAEIDSDSNTASIANPSAEDPSKNDIVSDMGNEFGDEKLNEISTDKGNEEILILLKEERKRSAEATHLAVKDAVALVKQQYEQEIAKAEQKAKQSVPDVSEQDKSELHNLRKQIEEVKQQKDEEIAAARASFELELSKKQELSLHRYKKENDDLRRRLQDMETAATSKSDVVRIDIKTLQEENTSLKKELEDLKRSFNEGRRLARSVVPSDKMIANMSAQARRELKRRIERFEE